MAEVANFLAGLSAANLRRPLLRRPQSSSVFSCRGFTTAYTVHALITKYTVSASASATAARMKLSQMPKVVQ